MIGAALLTFCTPAPAVTGPASMEERCVKTAMTFAAVVDDVTSEAEARGMFDGLQKEDQRWLVENAFPAYKLTGEPPLEVAVPIIYEHCMKRGTI